MVLSRKEIIEEYRRIEEKGFKFLSTFILFWFTIIFFFLKDELVKPLDILSNLFKIFKFEFNLPASFFGLILIVYLFLFLFKYIFELLEISLDNKVLDEKNLTIHNLKESNQKLSDIILKSTILSFLLPGLFLVISFMPQISIFTLTFELYIAIFIILVIYVLMPLYVIVNDFISNIKKNFWINFLDYNSVISGTITIFILLKIKLPYYNIWVIFYVILLLIMLVYSIKYTMKLFDPESIRKFKFIKVDKEVLGICLIYILIMLIIIIQNYKF